MHVLIFIMVRFIELKEISYYNRGKQPLLSLWKFLNKQRDDLQEKTSLDI